MPDFLFSYRGDPVADARQTATEAREGQARFDVWVAGLGEAAIVPGTPVRDCQRVGGEARVCCGKARLCPRLFDHSCGRYRRCPQIWHVRARIWNGVISKLLKQ